jgi:hypothetical protein
MTDRYMVIHPDTLEALRRAGYVAKLEARIEELEKYQCLHSQCDKSSLEIEKKLVQRLGSAHTRIEKLEAALREIVDRAEHRMGHAVSDDVCVIARKALEGKDD